MSRPTETGAPPHPSPFTNVTMASTTTASWSRCGEWPQLVENEAAGRALHARLDAVELRERAVLVVAALDQQQRLVDPAQEILDRPRRELRVQPDVGPAEEGVVDARVVLGEALLEVGVEIALADLGDALDAHRLDERVRRQTCERPDGPPGGRGVDQGDGGAVGMADEDGAVDAEPVEQRRKHGERLVMHETGRAPARQAVGGAITET